MPITPIDLAAGAALRLTIRPPGSKSLTNRYLLLAAMAQGESTLSHALVDADDAQVMLRALRQLGVQIRLSPGQVRVIGTDQWHIAPGVRAELNLMNAGTATRFLTAASLLAPKDSGGVLIDGDARMRERPIRELANALESLGTQVQWMGVPGFPPIRVLTGFPSRANVSFGATASSQFVSALMLVAPRLPLGLAITLTEAPTSEPYLNMTARVLEQFGVEVNITLGEHRSIRIAHQAVQAQKIEVEPDASGATYFAAAAALLPGAEISIDGLPSNSLQGDAGFFRVLEVMGCELTPPSTIRGPQALRPVDVDLADMPDTAMTAAVLACFAVPTPTNPSATTVLRGLRTLRVKETDRLTALTRELSKLGVIVEIIPDSRRGKPDEAIRITPPPGGVVRGATPPVYFDTYHDHRMAMSLALVGLRRANVFIRDPACVRKTYPGYWADFAKLYRSS